MSPDVDRLADEYFEALGAPKPGTPFNLLDTYRFAFTLDQLAPGSVLDVGTYFGDFLMVARRDGRAIAGTDVNAARVELANSNLGEDVVVEAFRNGDLSEFEDSSFDNVVCTEVLEHVARDADALLELCRVARKRVVVTVPFRESIRHVLCLHCNTYTPLSGHLHFYDLSSFSQMAPDGWRMIRNTPFATKLTRALAKRLPNLSPLRPLLHAVDRLPGRGKRWLLVVLERNGG